MARSSCKSCPHQTFEAHFIHLADPEFLKAFPDIWRSMKNSLASVEGLAWFNQQLAI
jgi:hypothetical protein